MLFVYPSISNNFNEKINSKLEITSQYLEENLAFPIMGTLEDSYFSREFMFDTEYHLNDAGRAIRTETVIRDLCLEIENGCKQ